MNRRLSFIAGLLCIGSVTDKLRVARLVQQFQHALIRACRLTAATNVQTTTMTAQTAALTTFTNAEVGEKIKTAATNFQGHQSVSYNSFCLRLIAS